MYTHYPDSPFGNVAICEHGNIKMCSLLKECVYCDYDSSKELNLDNCIDCGYITWHNKDKCLRWRLHGPL